MFFFEKQRISSSRMTKEVMLTKHIKKQENPNGPPTAHDLSLSSPQRDV
jgi:hypothetical protein